MTANQFFSMTANLPQQYPSQLKFYYGDPSNDFFSCTHRATYPCDYPTCQQHTLIAPFCSDHLTESLGLIIQPTEEGLFAQKQFQMGEIIAPFGLVTYNGFRTNTPKRQIEANRYLEGIYGSLSRNCHLYSVYLDQMMYDCAALRFIGAYARRTTDQNRSNAKLMIDDLGCYLQSIRHITHGEEIFVNYEVEINQILYEDSDIPPNWYLDLQRQIEYQDQVFLDQLNDLTIQSETSVSHIFNRLKI